MSFLTTQSPQWYMVAEKNGISKRRSMSEAPYADIHVPITGSHSESIERSLSYLAPSSAHQHSSNDQIMKAPAKEKVVVKRSRC
ncbi:hypothetical protein FOPE_06056 [Fonsecaea pedrosoi]|nr:hypothetical protein FOPE_06056 [Fonsecaea pedrosoi]